MTIGDMRAGTPAGEMPADRGAESPPPAEWNPSALDTWREAVGELWAHRHLLHQLALRDVRIRYKQAVMGFAWAIFMPVVIVLAGIIVRYAMARLSGSPMVTEEISGMAVKAVGWSYFVGALGFAVASLTGNMTLVSKIYFPREVLPLSATLAQTFDTAVGAVALAAVLPFLGVTLSLQLLWVLPVAVLLLLFTAASGLFLSCANLFFRDVKYIVRVLITFGIFFTPVFFEPADFGAVGAQLLMLNPLGPMLEALRLAVVEGHDLLRPLVAPTSGGGEMVIWAPWHLAYSTAWTLGLLLGSTLLFHRAEFKFAEYV